MATSEKRFNNKTAIVTGAASGIGYSISERLIKEGASVIGADLNEDGLRELEKTLESNSLGSRRM